MARQRRTFTPEFKLQMVRLFENEKSKSDIVREYDLTENNCDNCISIFKSGSEIPFSHLEIVCLEVFNFSASSSCV